MNTYTYIILYNQYLNLSKYVLNIKNVLIIKQLFFNYICPKCNDIISVEK